jgi:FAD/FMN-containing dehydrogenase
MPETALEEHARKRQALAESIQAAGGAVRLGKSTSNLFRTRKSASGAPVTSLDVRSFNQVLCVDAENLTMDVEGMTPYETAVAAALVHGCLPAVVPELKTITVGGALTGVGIESSSFRYGFVHETAVEMDILLPDGRIVLCRPDNEHRALFYGFANSYGTLGYVIRARIKVVRAKPYVELRHQRFSEAAPFLAEMERLCAENRSKRNAPGKTSTSEEQWDFVEGSVFSPTQHVLTTARFVDALPSDARASDYKYLRAYYQTLEHKTRDFLTASDYIWRWDTDWFWCSRQMGIDGFWKRLLLGRWVLGSRQLWKIFNWYRRNDIALKLAKVFPSEREKLKWEPVIQDVEVPARNGVKFLEFFHREIGIKPVWVCPVQTPDPSARFDLYTMSPDTLYLNFGFWDSVRTPVQMPRGHFNRLVEAKVEELGGRKSLYSESFYTEEEFWRIYDGAAYARLKALYDPEGRLLNLYQKTVRSL